VLFAPIFPAIRKNKFPKITNILSMLGTGTVWKSQKINFQQNTKKSKSAKINSRQKKTTRKKTD